MYGVVDAEEDVRGIDAVEERGREGKERAGVDGEEEKVARRAGWGVRGCAQRL